MAGLSSNVMNMKFMQNAKDGLRPEGQDTVKKVKDSSEWLLSNSLAVRSKLKPAIKVKTVGFGSIASLTNPPEQEKPSIQAGDEEVCLSQNTDSITARTNHRNQKRMKRKSLSQTF